MPFDTNRRDYMSKILDEIEEDFNEGRILSVYVQARNPHGDREGDVCFDDKEFHFDYVVSEQDPSFKLPNDTQSKKKLKKKWDEIKEDIAKKCICDVFHADMDSNDWVPKREKRPPQTVVLPAETPAEIRQEGTQPTDLTGPHAHEIAFAYSDVAWERKEVYIAYRVVQHIDERTTIVP